LAKEMAHYANDCWDAEILTTHGWIECVGIADRACYDLTVHGKKARMSVYENFPEPKVMSVLTCKPNKSVIGKQFQKAGQNIIKYLENADEASLEDIERTLCMTKKASIKVADAEFELTPDMVAFEKKRKKNLWIFIHSTSH
jgi:glycyl-tRNA synthetase